MVGLSQPANTTELTIETHVINVVLLSLLLTLNIFHTLLWDFIVNFEHVNAGWDVRCVCSTTSNIYDFYNNYFA